jgi:hypothetical protein
MVKIKTFNSNWEILSEMYGTRATDAGRLPAHSRNAVQTLTTKRLENAWKKMEG